MMHGKSQALPHAFWLEVVMCATYVLNRCPTKALQTVIPYEAWYGRKPSIAQLHVFGCLAYALVPQQHRTKLDDKAIKCIFVKCSSESKGYCLSHLQTKKILVNQDVVFVENVLQPLLSCTKETHVCSQDIYDTLLPLFNNAHSNVEPFDAQVEDKNQPLQVHDQQFDDGHVDNVVLMKRDKRL